MGQYTPELLAKHLGDAYDPEATHIIETHAGARTRMIQGGYKAIGNVPDFSQNEAGTMVVLEQLTPPVPEPEPANKEGIARVEPGQATMVADGLSKPLDPVETEVVEDLETHDTPDKSPIWGPGALGNQGDPK